jgi:uncharacterized protein (DUF58 family)
MILSRDEIDLLMHLRVAMRHRGYSQPLTDFASCGVGGSAEFYDYKGYVPGESTRHIDWNRYHRDGSLFVRQYERQERPEWIVVMDLSASVAASGKSRAVRHLTAALCFCLLNQGLAVTLYTCPQSHKYTGRHAWNHAEQAIASVPEHPGALTLHAMPRYMENHIIVISDLIFSDGFDQFKNCFNLSERQCSLINVQHSLDENPNLRGHLELTDAQNGHRRLCRINAHAIETYRKNRKTYYEKIEMHCLKMNWFYTQVNAESPLIEQMGSIAFNGVLLF